VLERKPKVARRICGAIEGVQQPAVSDPRSCEKGVAQLRWLLLVRFLLCAIGMLIWWEEVQVRHTEAQILRKLQNRRSSAVHRR